MKSRPLLTVALLLSLLFPAILLFSNAEAAGELSEIKICLDPGHGGTDPGAINSIYSLNESDINLDVSFGLKYLLEGASADVVMTRTGDEYLTNSDRYTYCNEQQATILISVHTNSVTDSTWDGSMALYGPRESPDLAQAIYDVMFPFLRDTAPEEVAEFTDYGLDHFASGVLFKSDMPAAMMEPLLMSNEYEAPLLVEPIFSDPAAEIFNNACSDFTCRRGQIAQAIFQGTLSYFDGQSGAAHVAAIDMSYRQKRSIYFIDTVIAIQDGTGQPVPSAEVVTQFTYPDGEQSIITAVTGTDGVANSTVRTRAIGTYQTDILEVTKTDWNYDAAANVVDSAQLTIP